MIIATPAPKTALPKLLWASYVYAALLAIFAVVALMGIGGFDFAHIAYETPGSPVMAALLAGLHIYALPFVLRLRLSSLARFFSALFSIAAPLFVLGYVYYLESEHLLTNSWPLVTTGVVMLLLGVVSFAALNGRAALRLQKTRVR